MNETRSDERRELRTLEVVTLYRDRQNLDYERAIEEVANRATAYTMFSVVGLVANASDKGLALKVEGQRIMAENLLQPNERYLLKLTMSQGLPALAHASWKEIPPRLIVEDDNYHHILLKATCRWHTPEATSSSAGFALDSNNPPEIIAFISECFRTEG